MRSIMKKCSMVVALLVSALAVVAAPLDFIPGNSVGVIAINTDKAIDNPVLNGMFAAKANAMLKQVKLNINDLRGDIGIGVISNGKAVQLFCVGEFSPLTVSALRNAIAKDAAAKGRPKAVKVNGKPGFADDKARMIFYSPTTVILQINVEGAMPFGSWRQGGVTKGKAAHFLVAAIDFPSLLKILPPEKKQGMPPQFKDIKMVGAVVDFVNNAVTAKLTLKCKTPEACNFLVVVIDQLKAMPQSAPFVTKFRFERKGNDIEAVGSITIEEIMAAVQKASAPAAAPAAR